MCCGCQERKSITDLLRLQMTPLGNLEPVHTTRKGTRSAWVCTSLQCINTVVKQPKKCYRSLRTVPKTHDLLHNMQSWLWRFIVDLFKILHRSGLIYLPQKSINTDNNVKYWFGIEKKLAKCRQIEYFDSQIPRQIQIIQITSNQRSVDPTLESQGFESIGVLSGKTSTLFFQQLCLYEAVSTALK